MKRIGGLVLVTACMGVLSSCVSLQGLSVRSHGDSTGGSHDFSDVREGGGSVDSGVADATAMGEEGSEAVRAEELSRGLLPGFGAFDRASADFSLFDPCKEIPKSAFDDAGLTPLEGRAFHSGDAIFCSFTYESEGERGVVTVASSDTGIGEVEVEQGREVIYEGKFLPVTAFKDPTLADKICTVNLSTQRGLLSVSYSRLSGFGSQFEQCLQAEKILSELSK